MKRIVVSAAVLSLAIAGVSSAQATPAVEKVTGGGQITTFPTGPDGAQEPIASGPGSTIAFNAQEDAEENVKGQIQFVDRPNGPGRPERVLHAAVTCLNVLSPGEGGMARIGGVANKTGEFIVIDVTDDGQGQDAMDMIDVRVSPAPAEGEEPAPSCEITDEDEFSSERSLGRGNVKIHSGGEEEAPEGEEPPAEGETTSQGGAKGGKGPKG